MLRHKDTIEIQIPKLTAEETEIIKQLGFCGSTKKLLQVFCMDCKTLVSIETFIHAHSNHSAIENDAKNAKNIFKILKPSVDLKYELRIKNLQEKIKSLAGNLKDLQLKKSAARFLVKTDSQIQEISEKLQKNCKKVENWIEIHDNESIDVLNILKERVSRAEKQFDDFKDSIEQCSQMNPIINNYNLMNFSQFLDNRMNNDQNFRIHEVPKASVYSKKVYFNVFCDITSVILENLIQTYEVYAEEIDLSEVENMFVEGVRRTFEKKNGQFEKGENLRTKFEFVKLDDVSCYEEKKIEDCAEKTRKPEDTHDGEKISQIESKSFDENTSGLNESGTNGKKKYRGRENGLKEKQNRDRFQVAK